MTPRGMILATQALSDETARDLEECLDALDAARQRAEAAIAKHREIVELHRRAMVQYARWLDGREQEREAA